jgi:hypothetical protein
MSYGTVRRRLPCGGNSVLPHIQTAADFIKKKNIYIRVNEREQRPRGARTMMNRIHTANPSRVNSDSRIGLFGEKEGMLWEDPLLKPRKDIVYR